MPLCPRPRQRKKKVPLASFGYWIARSLKSSVNKRRTAGVEMTSQNAPSIPRALLSHYGRVNTRNADEVLFGDSSDVGHQALSHALRSSSSDRTSPRALNVNLPFCPVRCLNCENDAIITHDGSKIDRYLDDIELEATLLTDTLGFRPRLQQLHLAGGSPNYLQDRQLVRLMAILEDHFIIDEGTEQSLDANPKRTSPSQLTLLKALGFDQITLSVRDMDPSVQLAIGRTMSFEMIHDVFDSARDAGFETIGTDVLYGLPCQTPEGMQRTIEKLQQLSPDRIACFAFSRRAATSLSHQSALDHCTMPSLADKLAIFNAIVEGLSDDYDWIGLDSFAKTGDQLAIAQREKRLFKSWMGYSHLPSAEVHGLGTSAISDLDTICVQNATKLSDWSEALDNDSFPVRGGTLLGDNDRMQRDAIRALMCNMELRDYSALFDDDAWKEETLSTLAEQGLLTIDAGVMRISEQGRFALPHMLAH